MLGPKVNERAMTGTDLRWHVWTMWHRLSHPTRTTECAFHFACCCIQPAHLSAVLHMGLQQLWATVLQSDAWTLHNRAWSILNDCWARLVL
jgi:hypothetical protein